MGFNLHGELQYSGRLSISIDSLDPSENTSGENTSGNADPARNDMDKNENTSVPNTSGENTSGNEDPARNEMDKNENTSGNEDPARNEMDKNENTSVPNTSGNEDPARNDMDKNSHGCSHSSSYYSKVDQLFGVKDIRKFISQSYAHLLIAPFLIAIRRRRANQERIDNDHSFLSELESFCYRYRNTIPRSKNADPHYDLNLYDTNESWNNQIKGSIHSFLCSKICRDSAILSGSDKYNAISNSICGEGGNSSEGKNFNFNIRTHGNDNDLTLKESSNNSHGNDNDLTLKESSNNSHGNDNDLTLKESSNNSNKLSLYSKNLDLYKSLWVQCENENCYGLNYKKFLKSQMNMCEYCGYHFKMNNSSDRIELLIDPGTWSPMDEDMISLDPSEFLSDKDEEELSYFDEEEPSSFDEDEDEEELSYFDEEEPSCSYSDEEEKEPSDSDSDEEKPSYSDEEEEPSDSDEDEKDPSDSDSDEEKPSDSDEEEGLSYFDEEEPSSFDEDEDEEELSSFDEDEDMIPLPLDPIEFRSDEDEEEPSSFDEEEEPSSFDEEEEPSDSDEDEEELSYFDEEEPSSFDEDEEEPSDSDEDEEEPSDSDEDEEELSYFDEEEPSSFDEDEDEDEEEPSSFDEDEDEDEEEPSSFDEDEEELSSFDEDEDEDMIPLPLDPSEFLSDEDEEEPSDSDEDEEEEDEEEEEEDEEEEEEDEEELSCSYSDEEEEEEELSYKDRIDSYQRKTGLTEAIQTGTGQLKGIPIAIGVMDFQFIGGSMGSVVGEKITRLIEYASNHFLPLILVCASGGARMQEGSLSLMQMAKISSALYDYQLNKKLFYVAILTSPTTGGVTASFGMLGDIIIAEPNALIAFAGKRIIEQLLHITVPEGFQETENLFDKGLFDLILPRNRVKDVLSGLLQFHGFFPLNQKLIKVKS